MSPTTPHILVVDDHADTRLFLTVFLQLAGYEVTAAGDSAAALELAGREHFSLYLLDIVLPGKSGIELCREIVALGQGAPVIFQSADAQSQTRRDALSAGGQAYLTKPLNLDALRWTIARLLAASGAGLGTPSHGARLDVPT